MDRNLEKLHEIDAILAKLVDGNDLTAGEAEKLPTFTVESHHLAVS